jgi:tRNA nucleotidyltransferase (CCA-adding enzyme)
MELVLAHRNMDFDCLASQVAVCKLHPAACIVPAHPLSPRIKNFLSLYRDQLPIVDLQYVDWPLVRHVYLVDCQKVDRLDDRARRRFLEYAGNGTYTVFDHHETDADSLLPTASPNSIVKKSGSAAAILVEKLQEQRIKLSALEATIIAAGIYEDTGCLTHLGSTELDARGIAYCLGQGADLERINHIIRPRFDDVQIDLFERLKNAAETVQIKGMRITVCCLATDKYIDGLSELASKLLENSASDALLAIVEMKDRIYVVARSETALFNLRGLAQALGGGGHGAAASAVIRGETLANVRERVLNFLMTDINAERTAEKVMSTPVRTIRSDTSMDEAGRIMLRHSLDGLVVMEHDEILGIVSKRDVDKARHHRLGHAPVRGFMSHPVFTVNAKSPLPEIQSMMVAEDIGRLPVLDNDGKLIGIVGRRELLAALYGEEGLAAPADGAIAPRLHVSGTSHLIERIDDDLLQLYKQIGAVAAELNMVAYLVGGCVRDLVLNRQNFDLDFVVEGSARSLAQRLVERIPESYELLVEHSRFDTATLQVRAKSQLREVDIATARVEYYEYPAALPTVEPSSLEQDLFRRDFTINALALCLHPDRFGQIVDYYNGLGDMNDKFIRILHPFSFIEDPTRIIRAARFGARLKFQLEARTKLQAQRAIQLGIFDNLGGVRLKEELRLILESDSRLSALDTLAEIGGGLRFLDAQIVYGKRSRLRIRRAQTLLANYPLSHAYLIYLGALVSELQVDSLRAALTRLHLGDDEREWILDAKVILQGMSELESCAKPSAVYRVLHGHDEHSLAIAVCVAPMGSHLRRSIKMYFEKLKDVKTHLRGKDLLAMGIRQGPEIGRLLEALLNARLDGDISTYEDEKAFVLEKSESLASREGV